MTSRKTADNKSSASYTTYIAKLSLYPGMATHVERLNDGGTQPHATDAGGRVQQVRIEIGSRDPLFVALEAKRRHRLVGRDSFRRKKDAWQTPVARTLGISPGRGHHLATGGDGWIL